MHPAADGRVAPRHLLVICTHVITLSVACAEVVARVVSMSLYHGQRAVILRVLSSV
jgi:hypothetical protein